MIRGLPFMGYSWREAEIDVMKFAALAIACLLLVFATLAQAADGVVMPAPDPAIHPHVEAAKHPPEAQHGRVCFSQAETREKIASRRLSEPFRLLRSAAGRIQGEALRAKLCRWNDEYVYEIALLRRDGHIVHVYLNATSGQSVGAFNDR